MLKKVVELLKLAENVTEDECIEKITLLQKATEMHSKVRETLQLAEDASVEDCVAAISKLKETKPEPPTESKEYADLKGKFAELQTQLNSEKRLRMVGEYKEFTTKLNAISGTPDDLAEEIMQYQEKDPVFAWKHCERLAEQQKAASVYMTVTGTPLEGPAPDKHEFEQQVANWVAIGADENQATAALAKANPKLWKAYREATKV